MWVAEHYLLHEYQLAKDRLKPFCKKFVFCELIGLSFQNYNESGEPFVTSQIDLDNAINLLNPKLRELNHFDNVVSLWMASITHKTRHGRLGNRYSSTLIDGIHYTKQTKDRVARNIANTFYGNIHATCN